jgi:hypothetical protein
MAITAPDGTITTPVEGPDPRWGMQAPILKCDCVIARLDPNFASRLG